MSNGPAKPNSNGGLLDLLKKLDPTTAILILTMGGGNLLATFNGDQGRKQELDRAVREIHELHNAFNDGMRRQQQMLDILQRRP